MIPARASARVVAPEPGRAGPVLADRRGAVGGRRRRPSRGPGPGVGQPVGVAQPGRRDVGVDLRRREALVAQQLLHDPQVRAAVEQVGREQWRSVCGLTPSGRPALAAQPVEPPAQAADAERARPGG